MQNSGDLASAATAAVDCMGVGATDVVLVLCNEAGRDIADALASAAEGRAEGVRLVSYPRQTRHGEEPPAVVREAMTGATVILAATTFSLSHTRARLEASGRGARIATMPGLSAQIFARTLPVDYAQLRRTGTRIADALSAASSARVTSAAGTDIVLSLDGRTAICDHGNLQTAGAFGNLPAGEAYIAPIETSGEGTIVFDGAVAGYGLLREPLRLTISHGVISDAEGEAAEWLLDTLGAGGPTGRLIAELGIGTNPRARLSGDICEDEKVLGTAHLAFGTNATFGGSNVSGVHIDGMLTQPSVELDGHPIIRGAHVIDRLEPADLARRERV